jgi:hypothetical protein
MTNTYRGFDLFNDIEDEALRTRNRAVVLANMAEDHTKNRRINAKGSMLILGYFNEIPKEERAVVQKKFKEDMVQRGFALV